MGKYAIFMCSSVIFVSFGQLFSMKRGRKHLLEMRLIRINMVYQKFMAFSFARPEVIKLLSSSSQLTIKFTLLVNVKIPTIVF